MQTARQELPLQSIGAGDNDIEGDEREHITFIIDSLPKNKRFPFDYHYYRISLNPKGYIPFTPEARISH